MKKTTQKLTTLFLASFAFVTIASAQVAPPLLTKSNELNSQQIFKLQLNNNESEIYYFVIKDLEGTILYSEKISEKNAVRSFTFDNETLQTSSTLIVAVKNITNNTNTLFEVKYNNKVVNDVTVSKKTSL
jgi:hypothetical protein